MKIPDETTVVQESLAVVFFSAGGWRFAIEARHVRGSLPAHREPGATAVEALLGLKPIGDLAPGRQCLCLKHTDGDREIHVDGPLELVELPAPTIHPLPRLLAERNGLPGLRALVLTPGKAEQTMALLVDTSLF